MSPTTGTCRRIAIATTASSRNKARHQTEPSFAASMRSSAWSPTKIARDQVAEHQERDVGECEQQRERDSDQRDGEDHNRDRYADQHHASEAEALPGLAPDRCRRFPAESRHAEYEHRAEQQHTDRGSDSTRNRRAATELAEPFAVLAGFRDSTRHLRSRVHDDVVAASIDDLASDARIRPEPDVRSGQIHIAADIPVDDDPVAVSTQSAADPAVDVDRAARERGVSTDACPGRHANCAARHARPALDFAFEPEIATGGKKISADGTCDRDVAAADEGASFDPLSDLDTPAGGERVAVDGFVEHRNAPRNQLRAADRCARRVVGPCHAGAAKQEDQACY